MAEKIVIQLETDSKEAVDSIKEVNKSVETTNETTGELTNSLDKMTGGAISGFTGILKSVKKAVLGFKSLKVAIAATGIGALLIAITAIGQAFTRSEEGQNQFAKLMGVIGAVTGQFLDAVADLGEKLITLFTNPQKALSDFTNLIKENLVNRFNGLLELVPKLGQAIGLLFQGKFKEAGKVAVNAAAKVTLGVENIVDKTQQAIDKTNEFIKATVEEGKIAGEIADQRAKADKVERALLVERAEADRKVAELREIAADKENKTLEERLTAIKEAGQIEAEITAREIEAAKLRLQAKQEENALGKSTKADLDEEAQLKARVIELETGRLKIQKALTAELTTALREQKAEEKRLEDEAKADKKERDAKELEEKKKILEEEKKIEAERVALRENTFNTAVQLAGAESKLGKAILLAKQLIQAKEFVLDAKAQIHKAKKAVSDATIDAAGAGVEIQGSVAKAANTAPPPFNIPFILSAIATGAGILSAVKSAVSATKSAASVAGGGVGTSISTPPPSIASTPPAFNIVGAGGTNQLAEAITGQQQQPVKAFVVSQDVTTAQSLERNIIDGASLG
jgi:hypothetical protein